MVTTLQQGIYLIRKSNNKGLLTIGNIQIPRPFQTVTSI